MKKPISILSLLLCAAMTLTACSDGTAESVSESQTSSQVQSEAQTEVEAPAAEQTNLDETQQSILEKLDVEYSYDLAVKLTEIKSNKDLGYRTAGSPAELAAGDMLAAEMEAIGLKEVTKDEITLDTWTFDHADLSFQKEDGTEHKVILGGYQTQFDTGGPKEFTVVYAGQGTEADLAGKDVTGKLVLIDINQRDNWWVTYPAYEAHLAGAAAILATQDGGYSEISGDALNAQDICGSAEAPAFSISRTDADLLKKALEVSPEGEATVTLDALSTVGFDGKSYNITGVIPGRLSDQIIVMSAHYDAYFDGFQDDCAAIALMMGIAKAMVDSGYQPEKTLLFCAFAAEEWGVSNTRYDWSTGAYNQVFHVHPEWSGKVMANINFELPGYYLGDATNKMRTSYELKGFIEELSAVVPEVEGVYPDGVEVIVPTQTWSDDFSMSIAGIPASVNNLGDEFARLYYHSQLDNSDTYSEPAFRYNHNLYALLMLAYDRCAVSPLDFTTRLATLEETIDAELMTGSGVDPAPLQAAAAAAKEAAATAADRVREVNEAYATAVIAGDTTAADAALAEAGTLYGDVLAVFKAAEDGLVRLTWEDVSLFPHELPLNNLSALNASVGLLESGDAVTPLDEYLYLVDNNWYAYDWSRETYRYFTDYVLDQPADRLMWGAGRVVGHVDLFDVIRSLGEKAEQGSTDFAEEITALNTAVESQNQLLKTLVDEEIAVLNSLTEFLNAI